MSQPERPDDVGKMLILVSNNQSIQVYSKIQDSPTADHPLLRNYSTHIFNLQSELQEVRIQRAKDAESNARIVKEIQCLYARIAELKGLIASLTIELHMLKDAVPKAPDATNPKEECNACSKNKEVKKLKEEFRTVMMEKRKRKRQEKQEKQKNRENTEKNKVNKEKKKKNKGKKVKNNVSSDKQ